MRQKTKQPEVPLLPVQETPAKSSILPNNYPENYQGYNPELCDCTGYCNGSCHNDDEEEDYFIYWEGEEE